VGAGEAFAIDAATFLLSAMLLTRVNPRPRGAPHASASVLADLRNGWREVRSRAWLWVTIAVFSGAVMCVFAQWYALAPVIARDVYGGAGIFGLLEAAAGAGALTGAIVALRWRPSHPLKIGMLMMLAWPVLAIGYALGAPLALVALNAIVSGFGFALFMVWWETALAHHVPPSALSRVSAWDWMGSLALLPVGYLAAGPLAASFGPRTVLGIGGAIGLCLIAGGLLPASTRELGQGTGESRALPASA
jgi:hypothetical protein